MKEFCLIKDKWQKSDVKNFQKYLKTFSRGEDKQRWEQNIVKTALPCLAVLSKDIEFITKEISKGNFLSFLDLNINENLTNSLINAGLISKIKDFDLMVKHLDKFALTADNWASIDTLSFNVKSNEEKFFDLAKRYLKSDKTFVRRAGVRILFNFLNDAYIQKTFDLIKGLKNEKEYYVNMAISWLVCEAFIKNKAITLNLIKSKELSAFTQNKAISKCRDSFRVSAEDKKLLLEYKI